MEDIVSRSVEIKHEPKSKIYTVCNRHRDGSETRREYTAREFRKMLQDEAKKLEIRAELAETKAERDKILDRLDRHLFSAQVYGIRLRSKYSGELPGADCVQRLYAEVRETR